MTKQAFRVVRVLTPQSPVARIDAVDEEGYELRLEVPAEVARGVTTDQVLVMEWSLHAVAGAPAAKPARAPDVGSTNTRVPIVDAEFATPRTAAPAGSMDPAAIDREFMSLMASKGSARTTPAVTSRDIDRELNTLLGGAGAKGQK